MQRFVILVDAGYVLAEGGKLCARTREPPPVECSTRELVEALVERADAYLRERGGQGELLRLYWYDAAPGRTPTGAQRRIARLPNVKLRLGRLSKQGQKGVDALLLLDLVTLARQHAIGTAFLLTGDEDLLDGVQRAQNSGVRVILWGIPRWEEGRFNQAESLVAEADEHLMLEEEFWAQFFSVAPREMPELGAIRAVAERVAQAWFDGADDDARNYVRDALGATNRHPSWLDRILRDEAREEWGDELPEDEKFKNELRAVFREALRAVLGPAPMLGGAAGDPGCAEPAGLPGGAVDAAEGDGVGGVEPASEAREPSGEAIAELAATVAGGWRARTTLDAVRELTWNLGERRLPAWAENEIVYHARLAWGPEVIRQPAVRARLAAAYRDALERVCSQVPALALSSSGSAAEPPTGAVPEGEAFLSAGPRKGGTF